MNFAQKTSAVLVTGLVAILLAGCAGGAGASNNASTTGAAAAAAGATTPVTDASKIRPLGPSGTSGQRMVKAVKVIDAQTVEVTPDVKGDSLYGKDFIVHVTDIATPAKGACGYDQALALAKATITPGSVWFLMYDGPSASGDYIDSHGDHYGHLDARTISGSYGTTMVSNGMADVPGGNPKNQNYDALTAAKAAKTGLWASCPGFGQ